MVAPWGRLDALAGRAVARLHSEAVTVLPSLKTPYAEAASDPARPSKAIRAMFTQEFTVEDLRGQRLKGEFAGVGRAALGATCLQILSDVYGGLGYALRSGDRIALSGRTGSPTYAVSAVHPIDGGDVLIVLTKV